ncbi:MAG: hypothetical protein A2284_07485 [Deltaproteobacteria bacterium RIFOXYA12_FULL_61_11]|nr:MAG: hypothetical protein A2284_07485 [Deltaproteobacteria bacterium RIFOXYA12_FULL_61_11]
MLVGTLALMLVGCTGSALIDPTSPTGNNEQSPTTRADAAAETDPQMGDSLHLEPSDPDLVLHTDPVDTLPDETQGPGTQPPVVDPSGIEDGAATDDVPQTGTQFPTSSGNEGPPAGGPTSPGFETPGDDATVDPSPPVVPPPDPPDPTTDLPPPPDPPDPTTDPSPPPAPAVTWIDLPDGTFSMGDTTLASPVHLVQLSAFRMTGTEVTVAQYRSCVAAGVCISAETCTWGDPNQDDDSKLDHPIVCVSLAMARTCCQWLGGDLPTEAQWEYAARGGTDRAYPWGNTEPDGTLTNCDPDLCSDGFAETSPVGSFPAGASLHGLYDMAGNVWEWVLDCYDGTYYATMHATCPAGCLDPLNLACNSSAYRVLRGGSWLNDAATFLHAANRSLAVPNGTKKSVGFRCAAAP